MARIDKKNILSGALGNLVFRNLDGNQIVQSHPGSVKQTKATQASGSEFRQCSHWAKLLRIGLSRFIDKQTDSYMFSRFTGAVYKAIQKNLTLPKGQRTPLNSDMSSLVGFEFNTHSPFSTYCTVPIQVTANPDRTVTVTIPEFLPKTAIVFPEKCTDVDLLVYVYATDFTSVGNLENNYFTLPLSKNNTSPATVWTSPVLPEHNLVLVVARLLYKQYNRFSGDYCINSKELNPAMVVFVDNV